MDEMTLVREFADAPLPDAAQLADVRAKLLTEIAPRRKRRFRPLGVTSVGVAAAAAVALVVGLSGTPRGPDPQVVTAAAVLDRAAEAALSEQDVVPRPDQYIYVKGVRKDGYFERWTSVDQKHTDHVVYNFPNAHRTASVRGCGDHPIGAGPGQCLPLSRYVDGNPRTVEETIQFVMRVQAPGRPVTTDEFIRAAGSLIHTNLLSPSLEAAVFRALKTTGAVVNPHDQDVLGRDGVGLVWWSGGHVVGELIFDPKTYQLLGSKFEAVTALKVVDHPGQR